MHNDRLLSVDEHLLQSASGGKHCTQLWTISGHIAQVPRRLDYK